MRRRAGGAVRPLRLDVCARVGGGPHRGGDWNGDAVAQRGAGAPWRVQLALRRASGAKAGASASPGGAAADPARGVGTAAPRRAERAAAERVYGAAGGVLEVVHGRAVGQDLGDMRPANREAVLEARALLGRAVVALRTVCLRRGCAWRQCDLSARGLRTSGTARRRHRRRRSRWLPALRAKLGRGAPQIDYHLSHAIARMAVVVVGVGAGTIAHDAVVQRHRRHHRRHHRRRHRRRHTRRSILFLVVMSLLRRCRGFLMERSLLR